MFSHLLTGIISLLVFQFSVSTPLDQYVWKFDENYKWTDLGSEYAFEGKVAGRSYKGHK